MKKSLLLLAVAFSACNTAPKTENAEQPESVAGVSLDFENLAPDAQDVPHSIVFLGENGGAEPIDTVPVACSKIEKAEYAKMGIPADALDACGGWYAGGGDYFYVTLKDGKAVVYQGYQEEQQEDEGYHWKAVNAK